MKIVELPAGYNEIKKIDLVKNISLAIFVNVLSLLIGIVLFFIGLFMVPINFSFSFLNGESHSTLFVFGSLLILMIGYFVLHELIHGFYFKKYSGIKAKYGFNGLYAYAKSDAYYTKKEYLIIGLAPVVLFGIICLILNVILQSTLFWFIYIVQILNISGAAGDLYVSYILRKVPKGVLIKDDGVSMKIYMK